MRNDRSRDVEHGSAGAPVAIVGAWSDIDWPACRSLHEAAIRRRACVVK